jgi:hypothetical protein
VANDWRGFNGIRVPTDPAARRIELRGAPYDDTLEQVMASYDAMLAQMARLKKGDRLTFVSGGDFIEVLRLLVSEYILTEVGRAVP